MRGAVVSIVVNLRPRRRASAVLALLLAAVAVAAAVAAAPAGHAATRTQLNDSGKYPRVVRLAHSGSADGHLVAAAYQHDSSTGLYSSARVMTSVDGGKTFTFTGQVPNPALTEGVCCTTLYELPSQVGSLAPGTLLWSGSRGFAGGDARRMSNPIYTSTDHGATWSYLSDCFKAPDARGVYEPEFSVDSRGYLVCSFSLEDLGSPKGQTLQEVTTQDGVHWNGPFPTVKPGTRTLRPGMPNVRRGPDGRWAMTYEICGTGNQYDCSPYVRWSDDGVDWGDPANLGTPVRGTSGQYFTHAPSLAWGDDGTAHGRMFMVGQQLKNADGSLAAGNGSTVLVNDAGGSGGWRPIAAPVAVANPDPGTDGDCENYSSSLLPSADVTSLLEIASDDAGACKPYYATGSAG